MKKITITEKRFTFFSELSARFSTKRIILHHTGGADIDATAEQIHQWHLEKGYAGIGYHFVIRKSGEVERGRPLWAIGAHAYGANNDSVGIHLSGDFNHNPPTAAQIESAALLIANLAEQYNIPLDRKHILGHRDTISTDCPGNLLYNMLDVVINKANWYRYRYIDIFDIPAEPPKIIWKPRAGLLTEHFAESEFNCDCCGKCEMTPALLELLELLRFNIGGYPLYIYDGYRCKNNPNNETDNLKLQHSQGTAADVEYPRQLSDGQFHWYIDKLPFYAVYFNDYVHLAIKEGA